MLVLDENYKVTLDSSVQNYQLEKHIDVKDKQSGEYKKKWDIIGSHGLSLKSVLYQYKNNRLADGIIEENVEVNHLIDVIEQLDTYIRSIVYKHDK
jgi:protein subunit release factor A